MRIGPALARVRHYAPRVLVAALLPPALAVGIVLPPRLLRSLRAPGDQAPRRIRAAPGRANRRHAWRAAPRAGARAPARGALPGDSAHSPGGGPGCRGQELLQSFRDRLRSAAPGPVEGRLGLLSGQREGVEARGPPAACARVSPGRFHPHPAARARILPVRAHALRRLESAPESPAGRERCSPPPSVFRPRTSSRASWRRCGSACGWRRSSRASSVRGAPARKRSWPGTRPSSIWAGAATASPRRPSSSSATRSATWGSGRPTRRPSSPAS